MIDLTNALQRDAKNCPASLIQAAFFGTSEKSTISMAVLESN